MSYLAAIKDVTAQPAENRNGIDLTRYTFTIDSPRFALTMHKQMEAALRARGELPPSLQLDVPAYFRDMVGSGELWVGQDGLPLRQILTLQFPAQNDEQVHSQIVVDFSKFGVDRKVVSSEDSVFSGQWPVVSTLMTDSWSLIAPSLPLLTLFLTLFAFTVLLIYYRRAHRLQTAVVILVIFGQVVGPLLSTFTNVKYFDAQTAKAAASKDRQANAQGEREMRDALGKVEFNPHLNPMEKAGQGDKETGRQGDRETRRVGERTPIS